VGKGEGRGGLQAGIVDVLPQHLQRSSGSARDAAAGEAEGWRCGQTVFYGEMVL
jgi:hypothetical protein